MLIDVKLLILFASMGLLVRIAMVDTSVHVQMDSQAHSVKMVNVMCRSRGGGGQGGPDPNLQNHKI